MLPNFLASFRRRLTPQLRARGLVFVYAALTSDERHALGKLLGDRKSMQKLFQRYLQVEWALQAPVTGSVPFLYVCVRGELERCVGAATLVQRRRGQPVHASHHRPHARVQRKHRYGMGT